MDINGQELSDLWHWSVDHRCRLRGVGDRQGEQLPIADAGAYHAVSWLRCNHPGSADIPGVNTKSVKIWDRPSSSRETGITMDK